MDDAYTRVRIPYDGGLEDAHALFWKQPYALAIRLPNGHTTLAEGSYPIGRGGVADLRLSSNSKDTLLRIKVASSINRFSLSTQDGVLEVQLERPPGFAD